MIIFIARFAWENQCKILHGLLICSSLGSCQKLQITYMKATCYGSACMLPIVSSQCYFVTVTSMRNYQRFATLR